MSPPDSPASNPVAVRAMTAADIPTIARWVVETPLWQRYGATMDEVARSLGEALQTGAIALAADMAGETACGFAICLPRGGFGRSAYLRLIGVRPGLTGSGVGAALLGEVERRALEISADLFLLVSDFNEGAQRFYKRHGYTQIGAIPGYVLPDVTELIFRKVLRARE
ncbi:MAG: GNAT family N-acetyltransferase [Chloroflexota bacterium]